MPAAFVRLSRNWFRWRRFTGEHHNAINIEWICLTVGTSDIGLNILGLIKITVIVDTCDNGSQKQYADLRHLTVWKERFEDVTSKHETLDSVRSSPREQQVRPDEREGNKRSVHLIQVDVDCTGLWYHHPDVGVRQRSEERQKTSKTPEDQRQSNGTRIDEHSLRSDEYSGADDETSDYGNAVHQSELSP